MFRLVFPSILVFYQTVITAFLGETYVKGFDVIYMVLTETLFVQDVIPVLVHSESNLFNVICSYCCSCKPH